MVSALLLLLLLLLSLLLLKYIRADTVQTHQEYLVFGDTVLLKTSFCEDRPFFLVITKVLGDKERFGY